MDGLLCEQGAVYLYGRKAVQRLHNRLIGHFHGFLDALALYQLGCHAAGGNSRAAAKGFEFNVADNAFLVNIQINSHDVAAFGVSYGANAACVLYFPHVTGMFKMIHYFFAVHIVILSVS